MVERSSTELQDQLEVLQDEVSLLKNEIKQTLVDLREFIMKDRTLLPPHVVQEAPAAPRAPLTGREGEEMPPGVPGSPPIPGFPPMPPIPGGPGARRPGMPLRDLQSEAHSAGALDAVMMGNIIWWLGTAKRRGLSLQQVTPFLEAYEMSGHLTPAMAKLILQSIAELDDREDVPSDYTFSHHDYADALLQLHDIICTPGYVVDQLTPLPSLSRLMPGPGTPAQGGASVAEEPQSQGQ